jgi:hypothetical protein
MPNQKYVGFSETSIVAYITEPNGQSSSHSASATARVHEKTSNLVRDVASKLSQEIAQRLVNDLIPNLTIKSNQNSQTEYRGNTKVNINKTEYIFNTKVNINQIEN